MDLSTVTTTDFKTRFFRDFAYLPVYDSTALYNLGDVTYYNQLFYKALVNGVTGVTPGTDATKWVLTTDSLQNYVMDQDIQNAFTEAQISLNQSLFTTDATITLGYLYLTAHYLCNDLKAALAGVNSNGSFPVASRSVGSVSESYSIPQTYLDNPILAFYTTSAYGLKYLAMVLPNMVGNIGVVGGGQMP